MLNNFVISKKAVAIAASLGLAGMAGVCGCKSSRHDSQCCRNYTPIAVQQIAPQQQQALSPSNTAPQPAPPADDPQTAQPYEEPAASPRKIAARFEALGGIVELDSLNEIGILDLSQTKIANADLQGGAGLDQLTQLDLSNTQITDAALGNPHWLSRLKRLSLNNTTITDTGLSSLQGLNRLQLLWLNETAVTDDGLAHLAGLTGMQSLGLNKTEVTDAGLVHLQKMKGLKYLLLGHTQVTDAGLQQLRGFSKLKGLSLVGTPVTAVGVEELRTALPDCQIIADTKQDSEENESNEVDPNADTRVIPRRLNRPDQDIRHALGTSPGPALPTERLPGFAEHGLLNSADSVEITRYYMGVAHAETRNMSAALPLFAETVGEAAAYYNIGVMLCKTGYWGQGERHLRTALEINANLTSARRWLSEIEHERSTIVSQVEFPALQRSEALDPVQVESDRRSDLSPAPVGVWTNLWDDE